LVRLRSAFGSSGVQPPPTAALALETLFGTFVNGVAGSGGTLRAIGNATLKPERQTEFEAGADAELFGNRFRMEVTYYNRTSKDALVNRVLGTDVGVSTRWENVGVVRNRGFEGLVSIVPIISEAFSWDVTVNGSVNANKVLSLANGVRSGGNIRVGYPLFAKFGRPILGFSDVNGNGIIEASEVQIGDTAVFLGSSLPTRQWTLLTGVSFLRNRVRLATQFDFRGGHLNQNTSEINRCFSFTANCRALNDPATPLEEQMKAVVFNKAFVSTGYEENGSFTRWRELSAAFEVPSGISNKLGLGSTSVVLMGRNLRTFTSFTGIDPETNAQPGRADIEGYNGLPTAPISPYWLVRVNFGF
jgi:TonB-dependent receptor-like protein